MLSPCRFAGGYTPKDTDRIEQARAVIVKVYEDMNRQLGKAPCGNASTSGRADGLLAAQRGDTAPATSPKSLGHSKAPSDPSAPARYIKCICSAQCSPMQPGVQSPPVVQCKAPGCGTWQHAACMGVKDAQRQPGDYYCAQCRVRLADPFWVAEDSQVVAPARPAPSGRTTLVANRVEQVQQLDRNFNVYSSQVAIMKRDPNHRLIAYCINVDDQVSGGLQSSSAVVLCRVSGCNCWLACCRAQAF